MKRRSFISSIVGAVVAAAFALPAGAQVKLLRALEEKRVTRVGGNEAIPVNVRFVAATNRDLKTMVGEGAFREDLYYRLNVIEVTVPPLRDRPGDILPLAEHLLRFFARQNAKPFSGFAEPVRAALVRYAWPGNIRELRNTIERGVILAAVPVIQLADLPSQVGSPSQTRPGATSEPQTLDQMEAETIRRVLASAATLDEAAVRLGIDPSTLYRKRKKYGI